MANKCLINTQTRTVFEGSSNNMQLITRSFCQCSTHGWESYTKWPTLYCPTGELETRLEAVEAALGITQPPIGT